MAVVNEPISPKQGKGIWIALIVGGLLLAIPIIYRFGFQEKELGFKLLLGFIGVGIIILGIVSHVFRRRVEKRRLSPTLQSPRRPEFGDGDR